MLKSILVSIHGVRDKRGRKEGGILYASDVAFGLIPEEESYECRQVVLNGKLLFEKYILFLHSRLYVELLFSDLGVQAR